MKDSRNKRMILVIIFVASIAVIIETVSYAYFTSDLGENTNQELVLQTGTMQMKFSDNDAGINTSLNFGESTTKEFILENTGTLDTKAKITFTNMINTYLAKSLTYKLEYKTSEESTDYIVAQDTKDVPRSEVASTQTLADNLDIPVGAKYYYRLTITLENLADVDQTDDINAIFTTMFGIEAATESPFEKITANAKEGNPNFANPATTDEGVYAMADDYGTSYYYRGAVENNYIKYGQNKSGQDMWWRIVRINGDGSLRIIYDGTQGYENGANNTDRYAIIDQPWNSNNTDNKYVGWMFGGAQGVASTAKMYEGTTKPNDGKVYAQSNETNCDAKTAVDNWYKENIVDTGYAESVVDRVFCNDRSIISGHGYGKSITNYRVYARLTSNEITPKFTCEEKNDAFTVEETDTTNGALTYPVGLITADEIVTAGSGKYQTSNNLYYLSNPASYHSWSMSPYGRDSYYAYIMNVHETGELYLNDVGYNLGALAPVINLSQEYVSTLIGDGSITNPYREA